MATQRKTHKILVCGGRTINPHENYKQLANVLDKICETREWITIPEPATGNFLPDVCIQTNGEDGVGKCAIDWATSRFCSVEECPGECFDELIAATPDLVVFFPCHQNTPDIAKKSAFEYGIETVVIQHWEDQ